jgi:hypothetical protein
MRKFISIILLVLMGTQLLPIKEMGKLLFNNQIVEEHPVDGCGGDTVKLAKELKYYNHDDPTLKFAPALYLRIVQYHLFEDIPNGPAREIHAPPPNC